MNEWTNETLSLNKGVFWYSFSIFCVRCGGRDSSVGIATSWMVRGWNPGRASAQTGPVAHPASYTMGTGSFPGLKRPGRGVDHPPPSSVEVEGWVELSICSSCGPSWPVLGRTLPLSLPSHAILRPSLSLRKEWISLLQRLLNLTKTAEDPAISSVPRKALYGVILSSVTMHEMYV